MEIQFVKLMTFLSIIRNESERQMNVTYIINYISSVVSKKPNYGACDVYGTSDR